jgi:hypothetical protein
VKTAGTQGVPPPIYLTTTTKSRKGVKLKNLQNFRTFVGHSHKQFSEGDELRS